MKTLSFVAISSETDHLPADYERQNWSDEALERKDIDFGALSLDDGMSGGEPAFLTWRHSGLSLFGRAVARL
jgi:hypothetical protein